MLPSYFDHMSSYRDSLLCRFLALVRVQPNKRYLLVMSNVLDSPLDIHQVCMHMCVCV